MSSRCDLCQKTTFKTSNLSIAGESRKDSQPIPESAAGSRLCRSANPTEVRVRIQVRSPVESSRLGCPNLAHGTGKPRAICAARLSGRICRCFFQNRNPCPVRELEKTREVKTGSGTTLAREEIGGMHKGWQSRLFRVLVNSVSKPVSDRSESTIRSSAVSK